MNISINLNNTELLEKQAKKLGISLPELLERIVNTYAGCLHKLEHSDMEKGYSECAALNAALAELF